MTDRSEAFVGSAHGKLDEVRALRSSSSTARGRARHPAAHARRSGAGEVLALLDETD